MINKKKVLVLNNSWSEYDLIKKLIKKYKVYTSGFNHPYVKQNVKHIKTDYRNHNFLNKFINRKKIEYVFPAANDLSLFTIAKCNYKNKLLDPINILKILHNKLLFRKLLKEINYYDLKYPKNSKIKFPILLKPKNRSTGRGIKLINNKNELEKIKKKYSSKEFFLEEYVIGSDHGVFTLVQNKKIIFSFFDTEQRFINPYLVSSTISCTNIPKKIKDKFLCDANLFIKKKNLVDGILHYQVKYNRTKKKIYIIEVTRRMPGDMYLKFAEISTGYPITKNLVNIYERKKIKENTIQTQNYVIRKMLIAKKNGEFQKFSINKNLKKKIILKKYFLRKKDFIKDHYYQRIGVIMLKFDTKQEMLNEIKTIDDNLKVVLKS